MKKYYITLAAFLLVGCVAIKPEYFKGPNLKDAYSMQCSGLGRTLMKCYQKASEICLQGYNIISKDSEVYFVNGNMGNRKELTIECK